MFKCLILYNLQRIHQDPDFKILDITRQMSASMIHMHEVLGATPNSYIAKC